MDDYPEYELDDDTRTLMISLIEIAIMASNVQLDSKHQESIVNIATVLGSRFGINIDMQEISGPDVSSLPEGDWPFSISISGS